MNINDALQILLSLFTVETIIGIAATLVGGFMLKLWPRVDNRLIPVLTLVGAFITQLINFFVGQPPTPTPIPGAPDSTIGLMLMNGPIYTAGFFDSGLFKTVAAAVLQWLFTDKLYDAQKKAVEGLKEVQEGIPMKKSQIP